MKSQRLPPLLECPSIAGKLVIDSTFSKGKKEATGFDPLKPTALKVAVDEPVKLAAPKVAKAITNRIT